MTSKQVKWLIWTSAIVGIFIVGLVVFISLVLPEYVQSRLLPRTAGKFGLTAADIQVRRIGWGGADLGPVILKMDQQPFLQIAAVHIDYSPLALLHGKIDGMAVSGLHLVARADDQGIRIADFSWPFPAPPSASPAPSPPEKVQIPAMTSLMPIDLDRIQIQNTIIDLVWRDIPIQVPLEIDLRTAEMSEGRLNAGVRLYPRGNSIILDLTIDQNRNQVTLVLEKTRLLLESMADLMELFTPITAGGTLEAQGRLEARISPFEIKKADLAGQLTRTRIRTSVWQVENAGSNDTASVPVQIQAALAGKDQFQLSCGPLHITGPVHLEMEQLLATLSRPEGYWHLASTADVRLPAQPLSIYPALPLSLPGDLVHTLKFDARQAIENTFNFDLTALPRDAQERLKLSLAGLELVSGLPVLKLQGTLAGTQLTSEMQLDLADFSTPLPDGRFQCPAIKLTADTNTDFSEAHSRLNMQITAELTDVAAKSGATRVLMPRIVLNADITQAANRPLTADAGLQLADARIENKDQGLAVSGVQVDLPLQWPLPGRGKNGRLNLGSMMYQGHALGALKGNLYQQEGALVLDGRHQSKLLKGLIVHIQTKVAATGAEVDFHVPEFEIENDLDLGRFLPEAAGFKASGTIRATGRMDVKPGSLAGAVSAQLDRGRLSNKALDLDLSGIRVDLTMDDLLNLSSAPKQQLRVETLRFGKITAAELQVDFQLEPETTLFIERAKMKWCLGMINTNAVRIRTGRDDYDVTLICDRLNLAMVLQQLGAASGSGEGAVNGVIPVRWTSGQLHFDKGFLYSTPGQPGTIALHGTEFLLKGLPPDSPQHTQLDIATEALKDYTYNWAKLSLESDQEILLIKLQLDGRPNRLLPFAYDQELGRLVRAKGQGEAEFKGINIDLNFRSPINEILNYQELIKR